MSKRISFKSSRDPNMLDSARATLMLALKAQSEAKNSKDKNITPEKLKFESNTKK